MSEAAFDLGGYLARIGLQGPLEPDLATLRAVVLAHASTIPFENVDVLLGRPPKLDLDSLQAKLVRGQRGGYCFEQNGLLRAGLVALGFRASGMLARVVRGFAADAPRFATHMAVRVALAAGDVLVDVGFGNLTPTGPVAMTELLEQATPHGVVRLLPVGTELVLQARIGGDWANLWRLCSQIVLDADYEVANWFTATHPGSPFVSNMIAARAGANGTRHTFLNGRASVRRADGTVSGRDLSDDAEIAATLAGTFGLRLPEEELREALSILARTGRRGAAYGGFDC